MITNTIATHTEPSPKLTTAHGAHHRDGHVAVSGTRKPGKNWLPEAPWFELGVLVFNGTVPAAGDEPHFSAELGEVWLHTLPNFVGVRAQESLLWYS